MSDSIEIKTLIKQSEQSTNRRASKKEPVGSFSEFFFSRFETKYRRPPIKDKSKEPV